MTTSCSECGGTRKCSFCDGTGKCPTCDGKSTVEDVCRHCGNLAENLPCPDCNNSPGELEADSDGTCIECDDGTCMSCDDEDDEST